MSFLRDGEFTITKSVPEFDSLISTPTDDLSVVGTERHRENIICVTDEATSGFPGIEIPETESLIPGRGEGILSVRGNDDVLHEVIVALRCQSDMSGAVP